MDPLELIARCKRGDNQARRQLYEQTAPRIYRLLLRMTGEPEDAADLTHNTYVKALTRIGQFDGRARVETWLYRIALNEALRFLNRARRQRPLHDKDLVQDATPGEQPGALIDLREALAALPTADRAILLMKYQQNLDYRTISEVLDIAAGTVASRLNRARQKLRAILEESPTAMEESPSEGDPNSGNALPIPETGAEGLGVASG